MCKKSENWISMSYMGSADWFIAVASTINVNLIQIIEIHNLLLSAIMFFAAFNSQQASPSISKFLNYVFSILLRPFRLHCPVIA